MTDVRAGDAATEHGAKTAEAMPAPAGAGQPSRAAFSSRFTGWGMTLLAIAFATGIAIGWRQPSPIVWPWLWASGACVIGAAVMHVIANGGRIVIALLAMGMLLLGAGWLNLTHEYVQPNDLSALIGDDSTLVHLEGVATRASETRARTSGSMARFDYRPPSTYFPMRVEYLLPRGGEPIPVTGAVLVRVDESLLPFRAGDRVQVVGFLLRPAMPRNPGEFDYRQYAKSLGQAGILTVSGRDAVTTTPAPRGAIFAADLDWRDQLRRRASGWLLANLPDSSMSDRDSMLVSLLLGDREAEIDGFYESFQRVGLAHILAISGFHLAVLAGFVMFIARFAGLSRRATGILIIAIVLLYLLMVEVRMPVLRAGVMTIAACIGMIFARRLQVSGLVALSAILLLLWRPDELFNPGFQLTYGTVIGLIHLAPLVRRRWFGRPNLEAATSAVMLGQWLRTAVAVSVVAWLIATPIAAYHFGSIALLGVPLSVIAVPLSAVILGLGYFKILLSALLPSAALLLAIPLTVSAEVLLSVVSAADTLAFSSVHVPPPATLWTFAALAWVCWWSVGRRYQRTGIGRGKWACVALLALWLMWPAIPLDAWLREQPIVRIDMLAVGDGSCYVVRSGDHTLVFDAGSSTDLDAGSRSIVPAMRRLGVRHIDAIAITHPNLDHYSAVLELVSEFGVKEILLTRQFLSAAEGDQLSPMAHMLSRLAAQRVMVTPISAGAMRALGDCTIDCLHPAADAQLERANDTSMVLRIAAGDRVALLCGDIQQEAMIGLMGPAAIPPVSATIGDETRLSPSDLVEDYTHYAIIAHPDLANGKGQLLLQAPTTSADLAAVLQEDAMKARRFEAALTRALRTPEMREVAQRLAERLEAGRHELARWGRDRLRADVMELPHHGSYNEIAVAFVERVRPAIVMQSTGWTRWQRDRWQPHLGHADRLATVRDGACSVIIERDGTIRVERFLSEGENAGGAMVE